MYHKLLLSCLIVCGCVSASAAQDLFERARTATNTRIAVRDTSGVSVRGGIDLRTGTPQATTILRGQADIGGGCGAFDFAASFREQFEMIPEIITNLGQSLIANAPMIGICWASPLGCDLIKHWQAWTQVLIQARYAQCHSSRAAAMVAGLSLRDAQVARCMQDMQRGGGVSINTALAECNRAPTSLRLPGGGEGVELRLIEDTLRFAGASPQLQTLAPALMGEVTLRAGETMGYDSRRPQAALQALYEQYRMDARGHLEVAIEEYRATQSVREQTLQQASIPGKPLARVTVEALAGLRSDPTRYETHLGALTTAHAVARLQWQCDELENALAAGVDGQTEYSAAERAAIQTKLESMRRNLAQFYAKLDVLQKYEQPAVDALMRDFTAVQETAAAQGFRAPAVQIRSMPYRQQTPLGYSK